MDAQKLSNQLKKYSKDALFEFLDLYVDAVKYDGDPKTIEDYKLYVRLLIDEIGDRV